MAEVTSPATENALPPAGGLLTITADDCVAGGEGVSSEENILVIDGDPRTATILSTELARPDRHFIFATGEAEIESALRDEEISLVIMNLLLPGADGRALLSRIRDHLSDAETPVFVLSALSDNAIRTDCFARGADGFFDKPIVPAQLRAAVETQMKRHHRIQRDLRLDALTGLPNRAAFIEAWNRAAAMAGRNGQPLTLGLLRVDRDASGGAADENRADRNSMSRMARLIVDTLRQSDFVARWGRREIAVFFPETKAVEAERALEKVLGSTPNRTATDDAAASRPSFIAGLASWTENASLERVLEEAGHALTLADGAAGHRVVVSEDAAPIGKKRILIGDDDELVTALVKYRLERDGVEVITANTGPAILEALEQQTVDLVVLDVKMPSLDGFEVLGRIRALPAMRRVPIMMLTATDGESDVIRAMKLGASDYVIKPFSLLELQARIRRLLR